MESYIELAKIIEGQMQELIDEIQDMGEGDEFAYNNAMDQDDMIVATKELEMYELMGYIKTAGGWEKWQKFATTALGM